MKIKRCFFCSGKSQRGHKRDGFYIRCLKCKYELAGFDTEKEAITEWNGMDHTADPRAKISPELFPAINRA